MTIQEKYLAARPQISNGDIVLFRGTDFIAKSIQYFDNAYYNHCGVVFNKGDRLFVLAAVAQGVHPDFLSLQINTFEDFAIIKPNKDFFHSGQVDLSVDCALSKAEAGIKYDFDLILRIAFERKAGIDIKNLGESETRDICSMFAGQRYATQCLAASSYVSELNKGGFLTPEDLVRFIQPQEFTLLFDDGKK